MKLSTPNLGTPFTFIGVLTRPQAHVHGPGMQKRAKMGAYRSLGLSNLLMPLHCRERRRLERYQWRTRVCDPLEGGAC